MRVEDTADVVIVGTGAGGATAARVLSEAGLSIIMLEEGPSLAPEDRPLELGRAMKQSLRDFATFTTAGASPFPLLLGRCVGGGTAVNSGIIWRMPQQVGREWKQRFGLGELVEPAAMRRIFETIESELGVDEVRPEAIGGNGELMREGARALGLPGRIIQRNAKDCRGSARCLQGCPHGARQSMEVSYVPFAMARGARLYASARAEQVIVRGGRAEAVRGSLLDEPGGKPRGRFEVHARRAVIVAAGAVFSPVLLRRSGLRRLVGERFQAHPGGAVVGRFREPVGMNQGATQSYEVPLPERGYKIESLSLPPELLAARLPGAGRSWQRHLGRLGHYAQWCALVRMRALGRVRPSWFSGGASVRYSPEPRDLRKLQDGLATIVRMMFAAGAEEVYPGVAGLPTPLTHPAQAELVDRADLGASDVRLVASHHFGTNCASALPARGVVGAALESHDVRALYVMDASVFPTNMGVNPQHTIMALAWRASERLANQERRKR